jgi:transcriptional regulator with XRE-family HTH domain
MSGKPKQLPEERFYRDLGRSLRLARAAAGKSQEEAGDRVDVTFQQLQKYETGANRIPVDCLVNLAGYYEVPLSQFLAPTAADSEFQSLASQLGDREFHTLIEAWGSIKDRPTRAALVELVKCMAKLKR